jgi:hypothetical protein
VINIAILYTRDLLDVILSWLTLINMELINDASMETGTTQIPTYSKANQWFSFVSLSTDIGSPVYHVPSSSVNRDYLQICAWPQPLTPAQLPPATTHTSAIEIAFPPVPNLDQKDDDDFPKSPTRPMPKGDRVKIDRLVARAESRTASAGTCV